MSVKKTTILFALFVIRPCYGQLFEDWHFAGPNVAFHKPAKQHPGNYLNQSASLAVDNITTYSVSQSCSHTKQGSGNNFPWWSVDLEAFYNLTGIRIYNRDNKVRDRLANFSINGHSPHGNTTLYQSRNAEYTESIISVVLDGTIAVDSITIYLPTNRSDSYLTLCEVQVFAKGCLPITQGDSFTAKLSNGYIVKRWYNTIGSLIHIRCGQGFAPQEPFNIQCQPDTTYNKTQPFCHRQQCPYQYWLHNGYFTQNNNNVSRSTLVFPYLTVLKVNCNNGFTVNASSNVTTCSINGKWSSYVNCISTPCQIPFLKYGHYQRKNSAYVRYNETVIQFGEVIKPVCVNESYQLQTNGAVERECVANGHLNGENSSCVPLCDVPTVPNGIYIDMNGKKVGITQQDQQITVLCDPGYDSKIKHGSLTCQEDRSWGEQSTVCIAKNCSVDLKKYDAENVTVAHDINTISFNETITLECKKGYKNVSGDQRLRCKGIKQLEGDPLKCEAITCSVDQLNLGNKNVTIVYYTKTIGYNNTLHLECTQGYQIRHGLRNLRCNEKELFDGDPLQCEAIPEYLSENSKQVGGLIGGVGGGCAGVLLVIAIILVLFYRRRTQRLADTSKGTGQTIELSMTRISVVNNENETGNEYSSVYETNNIKSEDHHYSTVTDGTIYNDIQNEEEDCSHDYYSFTVEKLPISAIRVSQLVDSVLVGDRTKLQHEFESFPKRMNISYNAAVKMENRGKNKYKEMFPYDKTRVVLQPGNLKSETDYINASFINGFSEPKRYIAAQAPFEPTLTDFWRMIWQMDVSKIVMLTKLKEGVKAKCDQYWPIKDIVMYGRIKVTIKKTETFSDFVIRHLVISKDDSTNRKVIQFHFTSWPDKDVPKYASSLVHFRQKAMHTPTDTKGPVVVHCSAGVGRTGTFIALDIMVEQGNRLGYVDVLGCVQALRNQRVMMVQTMQQYVFIHLALVEALMLSPSVLPAATFMEAYKTALETNPDTGKRYIHSEFEMLKSMSPSAEESQYVSAIEIQNRKKNRYPNILPVEESMPRLVDGSGNAYYINAVFLPSYQRKDAFIITQTPLENTQEEFWRLVYEHKVHSIVMMNTVKELENDSEIYWPHGVETVTYNNMIITQIETEEEEGHNVMTLEITVSDKKRKVKLFQYCHTVTDTFPGSPESVLVLMELVQYWQQQTGSYPVVVHCMNGVDKSGLFCVISAVIERLKTEHDVAISQTIEVMRNSREQLISSVEQFKFCHDVVLTYLKQFETYSNFVEVHI